MTLIRERLLFGAAVVAIVALFAATDVPAGGFPLEGVPVVRECTFDFKFPAGSVVITAGPDGKGGLAEVFPRRIDNGNECPGGAPCLAWDYQWKINDLGDAKFSKSHVSADSQITVLGCEPNCSVAVLPIVAKGERFLKFYPGKVRVFQGTYYTPVGVGPGTVTADFLAKKGWSPRVGSCAIAGADQVGQGTELPTTLSVFETVVVDEESGTTCQIERKVDLLGCQIGQEISLGPNCPTGDLSTETLSVREGGTTTEIEASSIGCDLVIRQAGSQRYCWPNGSGSMTCITF